MTIYKERRKKKKTRIATTDGIIVVNGPVSRAHTRTCAREVVTGKGETGKKKKREKKNRVKKNHRGIYKLAGRLR